MILILILLFLAAPCHADQVIKVYDGDTITVLHGGRPERIRFYGIDAPELRQEYGADARDFLARNMCSDPAIERKATDRYGRTIAVVWCGNVNLNELMIENGFAWVYGVYCRESFCNDWKTMQTIARNKGIGLWSNRHPMNPAIYRRIKK